MYNTIINPLNNESYSIFSTEGKSLLKSYVKEFYGGSKNNCIGCETGADTGHTEKCCEKIKEINKMLNKRNDEQLNKSEIPNFGSVKKY